MRHFFTLSVFALAALLGACGDNATTPTTTTGEIFGRSVLVNENWVPMADNSGITGQLIEDGNVVQTVTTLADGSFSFKNVQAGVYGFRFFKKGYTWNTNDFRKLIDTAFTNNFQFVGRGKYDLGRYWGSSFISTAEPDTTYWTIKPEIRYEVTKDIKEVNNVWIKDTLIKINSDSSIRVPIFGRGTSETRKIRFYIDYERTFELKRTISLLQSGKNLSSSLYTISTDPNSPFAIHEFISPNTIVRDSLGIIKYPNAKGVNYSTIVANEINLKATSVIPNGVTHINNPQRVSSTNELKLSLTD